MAVSALAQHRNLPAHRILWKVVIADRQQRLSTELLTVIEIIFLALIRYFCNTSYSVEGNHKLIDHIASDDRFAILFIGDSFNSIDS